MVKHTCTIVIKTFNERLQSEDTASMNIETRMTVYEYTVPQHIQITNIPSIILCLSSPTSRGKNVECIAKRVRTRAALRRQT